MGIVYSSELLFIILHKFGVGVILARIEEKEGTSEEIGIHTSKETNMVFFHMDFIR